VSRHDILGHMTAFVTGGAGFLLAVLWFDLMFDVQVLPHRRQRELPEDVLASISGYYRRVTTLARPMNMLVGAVMVALIAAIVIQTAHDDARPWVSWTSLALAGFAIGVALTHTVPNAVRLGTRSDPAQTQSRLARSICKDHLLCLASIASLLVLQLAFA
jgi:ABC-type Fe3+-siderophore transport system permease subunit